MQIDITLSKVKLILGIVCGVVTVSGVVIGFFARYARADVVRALSQELAEHRVKIETQGALLQHIDEDVHWHNDAEYQLLNRMFPSSNIPPPPKRVK